jgi:hypothetical protein
MALSVNPQTFVIFVPKADLTLVQSSPELRELNLNAFRLELKDWEDGYTGIVFLKTHDHNTEVALAGLTYARTVEVLPPYTVEFEDGQYTVNCVGANHNLSDVKVANQVSLIVNNAAGLINNSAIEYSSFQEAVSIDLLSSFTGTLFPVGTPQQPVNNFADANQIAVNRGFTAFRIRGDATIGTGDNIAGFTVYGENPARTTLTIQAGATTSGVEIHEATVTGTFDVLATFIECHLVNIDSVEANIHESVLEGTITLSGAGSTSIYDSNDGLVLDAPPPTIDFGGSGRNLSLRNYNGDIEFRNKTGPENVEVNISTGGKILIDSTVTNGTIRLTGIIEVEDNSTGTAVVDISQVIFPDQLQLAAFGGSVHLNASEGSAGTQFPIGTEQFPVNNLDDAIIISDSRGFGRFEVHGNLVVGAGDILDGYLLLGHSVLSANITLTAGCSTAQTTFENTTISGVANGALLINNSLVENLTDIGSDNFPSIFHNCVFSEGINVLKAGLSTPMNINFVNCDSGVPGDGYSALDFNGSASPVAFRNYSGGLTLLNYTAGQKSTIGFDAGIIRLDPTCTSGTVNLDGVVAIDDRSGPGFTLVERSSLNDGGIANQVWAEPITNHTDTTTMGGWVTGKVLTVAKFLGLK